MIQDKMNQILGMTAIGARLSPAYDQAQQAYNINKNASYAAKGLKDISENAAAGKFENYSDIQLSDVASRAASHNANIQQYKTALAGANTRVKADPNIAESGVYSDQMKTIEQALDRARNKATATYNQQQQLKNIRDKILRGGLDG